ncbi:MAG: hypothetical protein IT385_26070 [Deltaproteobacteria bacterium]|nr:hypothetical protein [Deltaproteobacteria bacterium]
MGDFREQLLKAGLVSAEQVRQAEAPPKPPPRPPGKGGGDRGRRDDGRSSRGQGPAGAPEAAAGGGQIEPHKVAQAGRLEGKFRGGRRWYYVSRRGTVPFLEVNDDAMGRLEGGQAGLVESPAGEVWLVDADAARALANDERGGGRDWVRSFGRG